MMAIRCRLFGHVRLHNMGIARYHTKDGTGVWHAGLYTPACVRCGKTEFIGEVIVDESMVPDDHPMREGSNPKGECPPGPSAEHEEPGSEGTRPKQSSQDQP